MEFLLLHDIASYVNITYTGSCHRALALLALLQKPDHNHLLPLHQNNSSPLSIFCLKMKVCTLAYVDPHTHTPAIHFVSWTAG